MSDAAEVAIEKALLDHLLGLSLPAGVTVAQPNVDFEPPKPTKAKTARWLKVSFLPAPSFAVALPFDSEVQHYGLLQVDAFGELGSGEVKLGALAAEVIAHFARGTWLTAVGGVPILINDAPRRGPMLFADGWAQIPVSVPYLAFAPPTF